MARHDINASDPSTRKCTQSPPKIHRASHGATCSSEERAGATAWGTRRFVRLTMAPGPLIKTRGSSPRCAVPSKKADACLGVFTRESCSEVLSYSGAFIKHKRRPARIELVSTFPARPHASPRADHHDVDQRHVHAPRIDSHRTIRVQVVLNPVSNCMQLRRHYIVSSPVRSITSHEGWTDTCRTRTRPTRVCLSGDMYAQSLRSSPRAQRLGNTAPKIVRFFLHSMLLEISGPGYKPCGVPRINCCREA